MTLPRITTEQWHGQYLSRLGERQLQRQSDGGPSDLNRSRKRAKGKAQRQARRVQRSGR